MTQLLSIMGAIVLSAVTFALAADDSARRATTQETGWRSLFNGKDLSQWEPQGKAHWRVEDGVIVGTQDGDPSLSGLLTTKEQFTDFELSLEFLIDEHGKYNSGVYLRNDPHTERRTGYQVNIGRGAATEYCGGLYTDHWLAKGDEKDEIRKPREWNSLHIIAKGPHVVVDLNGKRIVDYTDPDPKPKFLQKGVLGLQTYGAEGWPGFVKFRAIRIRPLNDGVSTKDTKGHEEKKRD